MDSSLIVLDEFVYVNVMFALLLVNKDVFAPNPINGSLNEIVSEIIVPSNGSRSSNF